MNRSDEVPSTSHSMRGIGIFGNDLEEGEEDFDSAQDPLKTVNQAAVLEENNLLGAAVTDLEMSLAQAKLENDKAATKYKSLKKKVKKNRIGTVPWIVTSVKLQIVAELREEEEQLRGLEQRLREELIQANNQKKMRIAQVKELRRKVNTLNSGVGPASEESLEATWIFPEELWMAIFETLTDGSDLWNSSQACMLFHRKLHPLKSSFLFGHIFPFLYEHLTLPEILKCRAVCKWWNLGVDSFFENQPSLQPHEEEKDGLHFLRIFNPVAENQLEKLYEFSPYRWDRGGLRFPKFRDYFGSHPISRNPFIGRSIHIDLPSGHHWMPQGEEEEQRYWREVYSFLDNFGRHIWFLTLTVVRGMGQDNPTDWTVQKMASFFNEDLFHFVPNIRILSFENLLDNFQVPEVNSIPSLPNLETLDLDCGRHTSTQHVQWNAAMMRRFQGMLQRIYSHFITWKEVGCQLEWPKLVELHLRIRQEEMVDLNSLLQLKAPKLQKLVLRTHGYGVWWCRQWNRPSGDEDDSEDCSFDRVLNILENITGKTRLTTLRIHGKIRPKARSAHLEGKPRTAIFRSIPKQIMPVKVKTLELEYSSNTCHSFLTRFPFLETLKLFLIGKLRKGSEYVGREMVEINKYFVGDGVSIYESNMWELLPLLKVFTFDRKAWTRYDYDIYQRKQV